MSTTKQTQLVYDVGYNSSYAAVLGLILILSYIMAFVAIIVFLIAPAYILFPALALSVVVIVHVMLYRLKLKGDNIRIVFERPSSLEFSPRYSVVFQNKVVQSGPARKDSLTILPYKTYTGVMLTTFTVEYHALIASQEAPTALKERFEQGFTFFTSFDKEKAQKELEKVKRFLLGDA